MWYEFEVTDESWLRRIDNNRNIIASVMVNENRFTEFIGRAIANLSGQIEEMEKAKIDRDSDFSTRIQAIESRHKKLEENVAILCADSEGDKVSGGIIERIGMLAEQIKELESNQSVRESDNFEAIYKRLKKLEENQPVPEPKRVVDVEVLKYIQREYDPTKQSYVIRQSALNDFVDKHARPEGGSKAQQEPEQETEPIFKMEVSYLYKHGDEILPHQNVLLNGTDIAKIQQEAKLEVLAKINEYLKERLALNSLKGEKSEKEIGFIQGQSSTADWVQEQINQLRKEIGGCDDKIY